MKIFNKKQKNKFMKNYKKFQKIYTSPFGKAKIDDNNIIISKNIALNIDSNKTKINTNVATIGESGSEKTRNFVLPNIHFFITIDT